MGYLGFISLIFVVLCLIQIIACLWEKRLVWPYGVLQATPPHGDPTGYGRRTMEAAVAEGFIFLCWAGDTKGQNYRLSYAFLLSPDCQSILIIGMGTILGMYIEAFTINSPSHDGQESWYSTDTQKAVEADVSRKWMSHMVPAGDFGRAWRLHQNWMEAAGFQRLTFHPGRAMEQFRLVREQRFNAMMKAGYIAYTDSSQTYWRYTLKGASKLALWNHAIALARILTLGRYPQKA